MNNKKCLPFNNPWLLMVESTEKNRVTDEAKTQAVGAIPGWLKPMLLPITLPMGRKLAASKPAPATLPTASVPIAKKTLPTPETFSLLSATGGRGKRHAGTGQCAYAAQRCAAHDA